MTSLRRRAALLAIACAGLCAQAEPPAQGEAMTARGTFEVHLTPQAPDGSAGPFGRLLLAKQFHGGLEGASQGQMLGSQSADQTAGAYVALEQVTGTLDGKRGSFALVHKGTMQGGSFTMDVTVVPESGTDELAGIAGKMTILIEADKHSYEFAYTLPH
jgi:hypothetical protein